jgi:glycerol uptake facilitator-like aquaporin
VDAAKVIEAPGAPRTGPGYLVLAATVATLVTLIGLFGPLSGAHFNPAAY